MTDMTFEESEREVTVTEKILVAKLELDEKAVDEIVARYVHDRLHNDDRKDLIEIEAHALTCYGDFDGYAVEIVKRAAE
jgi:hypothetical protein